MISDKIRNISPKKIILFTFIVYVVFLPIFVFPIGLVSVPFLVYAIFNYTSGSGLYYGAVSYFMVSVLVILLVDFVLALITYKIFRHRTLYLAAALIFVGTFFPIYTVGGGKGSLENNYSLLIFVADELAPTEVGKFELKVFSIKVAEDEVVKVRSISKNDIARPIGGGSYSIAVEGQSSGADAYLSYCHMDRTEIFDIKINDCFYLGPLSWQEEKLSTEIPWEYISTGKAVTLPGCFTEMFEKVDCPGRWIF